MPNQLFPSARVGFLTQQFDWTAVSDWRVLVVDSTYVFSAAHENLDDVIAGARLGDATLTGRVALATGYADADDASVTATDGEIWAGLIVYIDTGVEATSPLIAWFDTESDQTAFTGEVTGGAIPVVWPIEGIFRL